MELSIIKNSPQKAFAILEVLIATSLFAVMSVGAVYLALDVVENDAKIQLDNEALLYSQEGLEAVRNMRDNDYLSLTNGDHGLALEDGKWGFVAAPEEIDSFFYRTITIDDVYRDPATGEIAETGDLDSDIKKITSQVTWNWKAVQERDVVLTTYLSNWPSDDVVETMCTEFNAGYYFDTAATPTAGPPVDNCAVQIASITSPSTFFASANVGSHGTDVVVDGNYAYVAVDKVQKGFSVIDISDPTNPFVAAELDIGGKGRYIAKQGNYVYVGVDNVLKGVAVINVSNPTSPQKDSTVFNVFAGNQPAPSGNYLYMGIERFLYSFIAVNISDPLNAYITDWLNLGTNARTVHLSGNYAYLGVDDDWNGLRVVNISDPNNINQIAAIDVGEEVNAIEISGSVAYVGTEQADNSLQVVNISDPNNPVVVRSLNVGGEIQDLVIDGDYLYAGLNVQNSGLAAIDISNPLYPSLLYNLDIGAKVEGIDTDGDYLYLANDTNNKGLVIIGVTEEGMATVGTFVTAVHDTGSTETQYNFIDWDYVESPGTSVKFQFRTADSAANVWTATWVGPDGTGSTFYDTPRTPITLDSGRTGNRYMQVEAFLESDGATTPTLEAIRINYTP